ncbi:MAG: hypothetical protein EOO02_24695, partial [Chitinophagaceae bacterium]
MNLLTYLLEANLYLIILYGFYRIMMRKETFYTLNRFYLLFSVLISFTMPFIQASALIYAPPPPVAVDFPMPVVTPVATAIAPPVPVSEPLSLTEVLLWVYIAISIILVFRLLFSILSLRSKLAKFPERSVNGIRLVAIDQQTAPFSFFNRLFINTDQPGYNTVVDHELIHIRQRHSIDVLVFEILTILCWFNPIAWLMRDDMKVTHEYLADAAITADGGDKHAYAMYL